MGGLLLYYTLGSDPALWRFRERRERGLITHDKGYYHSYCGAKPKGTFRPYQTPEPQSEGCCHPQGRSAGSGFAFLGGALAPLLGSGSRSAI